MSNQAIVSRGIHPACLYSKADVCELMRLDEAGWQGLLALGVLPVNFGGNEYVIGGWIINMLMVPKSITSPPAPPPASEGSPSDWETHPNWKVLWVARFACCSPDVVRRAIRVGELIAKKKGKSLFVAAGAARLSANQPPRR